MKRALSLLLVLVMLSAQLTIPAFADVSNEMTDPYEGLEITSISATATLPLVEHGDGMWMDCYYHEEGEIYFEYSVLNVDPVFHVIYEDGSEEVGHDYDLTGNVWIEDNQTENHWSVGKHTVTVYYRDVSCDLEVEVVESPVESISAVAQKSLVRGVDSYEDVSWNENFEEFTYDRFFVYEADIFFTVTMKDGTVISGTDEDLVNETGYYTSVIDEQDVKPFVDGKNTVVFEFLGVTCECEIEVEPNPYSGVEISGENELSLTFVGIDKADTYTTKIVNYDYLLVGEGYLVASFMGDDGETYEVLYNCNYDENGAPILNENVSIEIDGFKSNTLETNNWLVARIAINMVAYYSLDYKSVSENVCGHTFESVVITDEKVCIDALVAIATFVSYTNVDELEYTDEYVIYNVDVETVSAYIADVFGLTDLDLTTSKYYDAESGMIHIEQPLDTRLYEEFSDFTYSDGAWTYTGTVYEYAVETDETKEIGTITVVMNSDFIVQSITFDEKELPMGDINGDGEVSSIDARKTLQYSVGNGEYDEETIARMDMNGDGQITSLDARKILQKSVGLE